MDHCKWLVRTKFIMADAPEGQFVADITPNDLSKLKKVVLMKTGSVDIVSDNSH